MLGIKHLHHYARLFRRRAMRNTLILLYHRVTDVRTDPQFLCVTPDNFSQQMEVLRRSWNPISLHQLGIGLREQKVPRRGVLVTMDDGYADNLYNAKPILERYEIPAIVFVASGYVGFEREYWWDELERLLLQPGSLPEELKFQLNGTDRQWKLGKSAVFYSEENYRSHANWNLGKKSVPTERHSLYLDLYRLMRPLEPRQQGEILDKLHAWSACKSSPRELCLPMTAPELRKLREGNLIDVGSHTISHPILSSLPLDSQRKEISGSRDLLEEIIGESVTSFAYPFGGDGDYTPQTVELVRDAGFESAFSTAPGLIQNESEALRLPRNWVRNWDGDTFAHRLEEWFVYG
jgi:peptidoglycan/xylan/chitin deacetylase (PgdA/CDA1 family)